MEPGPRATAIKHWVLWRRKMVVCWNPLIRQCLGSKSFRFLKMWADEHVTLGPAPSPGLCWQAGLSLSQVVSSITILLLYIFLYLIFFSIPHPRLQQLLVMSPLKGSADVECVSPHNWSNKIMTILMTTPQISLWAWTVKMWKAPINAVWSSMCLPTEQGKFIYRWEAR